MDVDGRQGILHSAGYGRRERCGRQIIAVAYSDAITALLIFTVENYDIYISFLNLRFNFRPNLRSNKRHQLREKRLRVRLCLPPAATVRITGKVLHSRHGRHTLLRGAYTIVGEDKIYEETFCRPKT